MVILSQHRIVHDASLVWILHPVSGTSDIIQDGQELPNGGSPFRQHAPLQSNITCFRVKQLQYGYM